MFTSSKELEQRKNPHVFVAHTLFAHSKKIHEPQTLNRKFKRQGVYFFLHKINQMVLPLWNVFKDIFSLDKFWSPMFKYLMGVFLHANNMYSYWFQISFQSISKYNHNGFKIASIVCSAWKDGHVGLKVTRPSFFGGVPSYFEALWYPHLYFYRISNT